MWVVANLDGDYVAKMEDVLETYERPYDPQQPVVCLDEKPVTLHADVRAASPAKPGREARRDSEYERCGTATVFCAVEPKVGRHFTFPTPDRSGFEFAQVAVTLALAYPNARTIHLVMDNLNIHRRKSLTDVYGAEMAAEVWNRFTIHYTPTHGSWLNQAEIEIGIFSRQCLGRRRIGSDFDGISSVPEGLEDVSKMPYLTAALLKRGYSESDLKKILGGNHLRVLRAVTGQ